MPILGKPSGITLEEHTQNVVDEVKQILDPNGPKALAISKFKSLFNIDLIASTINAAKYHDIGKQFSTTWQKACLKDYEVYKTWRQKIGLNPFDVSAEDYINFERSEDSKGQKSLLKAGVRHEFASLAFLDNSKISLALTERIAIAAHHGKLSFKHRERWINDGKNETEIINYEKYWNEFYGIHRKWSPFEPDLLNKTILERYKFDAVRAILQLADTRASRAEKEYELPRLEKFHYEFPYKNSDGTPSFRGVQELIQSHWDKTELILRAPTGSGKTDASMLWAKRQIDQNRAERVVIAMPTRFTSNALALSLDPSIKTEGGVEKYNWTGGLYHSSAWYNRWGKLLEEDSSLSKSLAKEYHKLARLLETPVTVSTIDHLCIALTGSREDHHHIFYNLANSCVIIDEADFYDQFVQANIIKLLEVLRILNVPFLIMSATVPESMKLLYGVANNIIEDKENIDKPRFNVQFVGKSESVEDIEGLLREALEKPTIIYANTIDRAIAYYKWFKKNSTLKPVLYHSRFTESDKAKKETELLGMLGKKAWKNRTQHGIAIMTQIGEMSINISTDFMISDICPFDRLAQRAGRISRFNDFKQPCGKLYVIVPTKKGELYPAPYGHFDKKQKVWHPNNALLKTIERIEIKSYSAKDLIEEVNLLYPEMKISDDKAIENQKELDSQIKTHWLVVPTSQSDEESIEVNKWKSRDIPPESIILVSEPDSIYKTFGEFYEFQLEFGISIPIWERCIGINNNTVQIKEIAVYDEKIKVFYSHKYSDTLGLYIKENVDISTEDSMI